MEADLFATVKNSIVFIDPVLFTMNEDRFTGPEMINEFSLLLLELTLKLSDAKLILCKREIQSINPYLRNR